MHWPGVQRDDLCLGSTGNLVGVDYSSTYPPEIKQVPTIGYHRALSAEGILSLKPTLIIHDNNIGPDNMTQLSKLIFMHRQTIGADLKPREEEMP
jgi:iron complex transport system substrate-binding protein